MAHFDVYPKKGGDFSTWLGDVYTELGITRTDLIGGSGHARAIAST